MVVERADLGAILVVLAGKLAVWEGGMGRLSGLGVGVGFGVVG